MFKETEKLLERGVREGVFPCCVFGISAGETTLYLRAVGRLTYAPDAPVCTEDTLFDLASLTKIFVTTMVTLRFLERGLLSLDDTLPLFFEDTPADKAAITLGHLLTHTSGLPAHFLLSERPYPPTASSRAILQEPLSAPVGQVECYSCMGFILLGTILERVSGSSLETLFHREVSLPLGLSQNTGYHPATGPCAPTDYDQNGQLLCGTVEDENARYLGGISANAGLFSTAADVLKLGKMLGNGGMVQGSRYLFPETLALAYKNYTPGLCENRGLGFRLPGGENNFFGDYFAGAVGHTGFSGTSLVVAPTAGISMVLLTNRVHPTRENLAIHRFRRLVHNCARCEYATYTEQARREN